MSRPFILIPAAHNTDHDEQKFYTNRAYTDAITRAEGVCLITARPSDEEVNMLMSLADGLLLIGGHDIDPEFYNEGNQSAVHIDRERDELEFKLLKRAMTKKIPILAICRGMQVMNVALGGTLYQDIAQGMPQALNHDWHFVDGNPAPRNLLAHDVRIDPNSRLAKIIGTTTIKVNSLHHQGIKTLATELRSAGQSPDGLIETIEHESHPFAIGVEWHPEELSDEPSNALFSAFIEAATRRS